MKYPSASIKRAMKPFRVGSFHKRVKPVLTKEPLMLTFWNLLDGAPTTYVAMRAGLAINSISNWLDGTMPTIQNFQAALNAIGYELVIVKRENTDANPRMLRRDVLPNPRNYSVRNTPGMQGSGEGDHRPIAAKA